ncbi:MAG: diaminopimelate epimerase [Calditrichia bacterium]|nr:diaminopimelate epimerase [Calditrichia bacterium]
MDLKFTKMHGTGNDFILIDNFDNSYGKWDNKLIKQICEFHTGIGADGFLALEKDRQYDFRMRFFNSDGYESDMCVNGSRCICFFAYSLGYVNKEMYFIANDGLHRAKVINGEVEVQVNYKEDAVDKGFPDEYILPAGVTFKSFINTGVPHVILETENIEVIDVNKIGHELRYHLYYQPEGTNVNFVEKLDDGSFLRIRTYERGVESETLSCGSGATAAALNYAKEAKRNEGSCKIETSGGILKVQFSNNLKEIYLKGPVKQVFNGIYSLEG